MIEIVDEMSGHVVVMNVELVVFDVFIFII
jgi:hypothetical protein